MLKITLRKSISIVLALCMVLVLCPVFAGAEEGVDTASLGLSSKSPYVKVLSDRIVVMSHYDDSKYYISSDDTPATTEGQPPFGIFSVLTSSSGYELSYADEEMNVPEETVASVTDGYILCVKDEESIYVPVVSAGSVHNYPETQVAGQIDYNLESCDVSLSSDMTGIGGKASDDKSMTLTVGENGVAGGKFPRYQLYLKSVVGSTCDAPFTIETNIYATGDATVQFSIRTYAFLQWKPNGEVWGMNSASASSLASSGVKLGELERGKWHRIAVSYDMSRKKIVVWADGERLTNMGSSALSATEQLNNTIRIGLSGGSALSMAAFDDALGYQGFYVPDSDIITVSDTDGESLKISTSDKSVTADTGAYDDIDSLKNAILENTDASDVRLLTADLNEATESSEVRLCMFVSQSGRGYSYYTFKPFFALESIEFSDEDGKVGVTAVFSSMLSEAKNVTAIMILKNSSGIIEKVVSSDTVAVEEITTVTIDPVETEGGDVCVFFIDNWETRVPVFGDIKQLQ